jgi:hypothetical protein
VKKRPIHPGENVGQQTPKDDAVPHIRHQRGRTTKHALRGRTEPRRGPTPPRGRGSKGP